MAPPDDLRLDATSLNAAFVERQYNNRDLVPEHPAFFERWARDSASARAALLGRLDLAYGPNPRHRVDLFPAGDGQRLLVFLHGGYWRALGRESFSWLAPAFVAAGVSVAVVSYRLCPEVRLPDIIDDAAAALAWLGGPDSGLAADEVVLAGHSAGGHLVGALWTQPRERWTFDVGRVVGGLPISGLFDFAPLPWFSMAKDLHLTPADVPALDVYPRPPRLAAPLVLGVGELESAEFHRQSRLLASCWREHVRAVDVVPRAHHFSVLDALGAPGQSLFNAVQSFWRRTR